MDQHPVPRNVTGFEFQLIGFMTLKQFFYLLFAAGVTLLFWKGPFGILSIPLSVLAVGAGLAFAFLPVQERPLEVWLKNFIISIYSPTEYVWLQERQMPEYLQQARSVPVKKKEKKQHIETLQQDARNKLNQYLKTIEETDMHIADRKELEVLNQAISYIEDPSLATPKVVSTESSGAEQKKSVEQHGLPVGIVAGTIRANNMPLSDMLIHIDNQTGETVRMLKTNSAGQFRSNLALGPGIYKLSTEDPQSKYSFKQYSFRIDDQPLHSWLIAPTEAVN